VTVQAPDTEAGALFVPVRTSARSDYDTTEDLARWFWYPYPEVKVADSFHDLYSTWGIGWALKALGISDVNFPPPPKALPDKMA
jgi:hypothetical protein